MIKTSWFVHPSATGCLSGKDAGSLIHFVGTTKTLYRSPSGSLTDVTARSVSVPFGDQGAAYIVSPNDVSFLSRQGAGLIHCERVWSTITDHYVGSGDAKWGGEMDKQCMSVENSSVDTFNIPNNDAFNTMAITAPMFREPVDLSSTDKPITAPFYKDIHYPPLAPVYKNCCNYGIQRATRQHQWMWGLGFLLVLFIIVLCCCNTQKTA